MWCSLSPYTLKTHAVNSISGYNRHFINQLIFFLKKLYYTMALVANRSAIHFISRVFWAVGNFVKYQKCWMPIAQQHTHIIRNNLKPAYYSLSSLVTAWIENRILLLQITIGNLCRFRFMPYHINANFNYGNIQISLLQP